MKIYIIKIIEKSIINLIKVIILFILLIFIISEY